jgi:CO/xanthine dehydrogenase Mo-binding subunit
MPHEPVPTNPNEFPLGGREGGRILVTPHFPLPADAARFAGEAVAMVIAETAAGAADGALAVRVAWEPLPPVTATLDAAEPGGPLLWSELGSNLCVDSVAGDAAAAAAAFAGAAHTVRLDTWVPRVTGVPMEPRAALGVFDEASGRYTLYAGSGGVVRHKADLAEILGVPEAAVRLVAEDVGGNFGTRNSFYPEFALVVWAAKRLGRPVKWTCERVYDSGDYAAVVDRAVALADWAGFEARRREARGRGRYRGIGLACYIEIATGAPRERAHLTVQPDRRIDVVIGTLAAGQGHETSFAQLLVEWLGVELEQVRLISGDTERVPVGGGSHSGRSMRLGGVVMAKAADRLVERGARIAAWRLEAAVDDLEFSRGRFPVRGTDRSIDLFEAAAAARGPEAPGELRGPLDGECDETVSTPSFPYGCAVCEVEVDPDTGVVEVVRYTSVDDVGRAINPLIVDGQTHGGLAQGLGEALWEHCRYDEETGQPQAATFLEYALPRADLLPMFTTEISEVPSTSNPLGLRGGGEGGAPPPSARP